MENIFNYIQTNLVNLISIGLTVIIFVLIIVTIIKVYGVTKLRVFIYKAINAANKLDGKTNEERAKWVAEYVNQYLNNLPLPFSYINLIPDTTVEDLIESLYESGMDLLDDGEKNNSYKEGN